MLRKPNMLRSKLNFLQGITIAKNVATNYVSYDDITFMTLELKIVIQYGLYR